jgi:hypothetical protein
LKKIIKIAAFLITVLILLIVLAMVLKTEKVQLHASSSCTKMACMQETPCCNSCIHDSWQASSDGYLYGVGLFGELPKYPADGCGGVGATLTAYGVKYKWKFYVVKHETVFKNQVN